VENGKFVGESEGPAWLWCERRLPSEYGLEVRISDRSEHAVAGISYGLHKSYNLLRGLTDGFIFLGVDRTSMDGYTGLISDGPVALSGPPLAEDPSASLVLTREDLGDHFALYVEHGRAAFSEVSVRALAD
jgi:hypothetical protein